MEYTSIGESCSVVSGGTPSRSKNEYWENGNIPWIKIGNIKSKYVNEYDELITEQGLNNSSAKLLKKGTILYTIFATLGEVGILDIEACTNQAIAGINITDPRITTDYLYYYLKSKKDYVNNIGRGVAQNNINLTTLKNFEIPLIDVDKQLNIVEILEKVERMICLKEKEIDDLDLLIKARFIEMFGDPIRNPYGWYNDCLNNVCTKINDGTHCSPESFDKGDYMYITAKNIKQNGLDLSNVTYVSEKVHKPIYQRCNPEFGDILYIKDGATTGIATINTMKNEFTLLSSVALLKYDRSLINGYYLIHLLNSKEMYSKIRKNMGGAAITRLTIAKIKEIKVIVPPIDLQNQFADFVRQVDKSRFDIKKSIIELEREVVYD